MQRQQRTQRTQEPVAQKEEAQLNHGLHLQHLLQHFLEKEKVMRNQQQ